MDPEIEKCMEEAQKAKDVYIAAYRRWFDRNRAYEMMIITIIATGNSAQDAWYKAASTEAGRTALDLLRISEVDKELAKYSLKIAISRLNAVIDVR